MTNTATAPLTRVADSAQVAIVGRPNVGKSTLFNRLTGRRDALVRACVRVIRRSCRELPTRALTEVDVWQMVNTPDDHVTRDVREGVATWGPLRFTVRACGAAPRARRTAALCAQAQTLTGTREG